MKYIMRIEEVKDGKEIEVPENVLFFEYDSNGSSKDYVHWLELIDE